MAVYGEIVVFGYFCDSSTILNQISHDTFFLPLHLGCELSVNLLYILPSLTLVFIKHSFL